MNTIIPHGFNIIALREMIRLEEKKYRESLLYREFAFLKALKIKINELKKALHLSEEKMTGNNIPKSLFLREML